MGLEVPRSTGGGDLLLCMQTKQQRWMDRRLLPTVFEKTTKTRFPGYPCTRHVALVHHTTCHMPHATTQSSRWQHALSNLLLTGTWTRGWFMNSTTTDHLVQTTPPVSCVCLHWVGMEREQARRWRPSNQSTFSLLS